MGLDIGIGKRGFIEGLRKENERRKFCNTCGQNKTLPKGTIRYGTIVRKSCPECGRPQIWESTNSITGKREVHEIVKYPSGHFKEEVTPANSGGRNINIHID